MADRVFPKNFENITDIKDVNIINRYVDDHLPCIEVTFRDQKGRYRAGRVLWTDSAFCMVPHYETDPDIKEDLIDAINHDYTYEREELAANVLGS